MRQNLKVVAFTVLSIVLSTIYCYQIVSGSVQPRLASWIIFFVGSLLSLISYFYSDGEHGVINNISNVGDIFATLVILAVLILTGYRAEFTDFDKACLIASGCITVVWAITQSHKMANLLLQLLMVAGYFPMINGLLSTERNTESFLFWGMALIVSLIAVSLSMKRRAVDPLAPIYACRACIFVSIILLLMVRIELS